MLSISVLYTNFFNIWLCLYIKWFKWQETLSTEKNTILTSQFFLAIKKTPLPIYFGAVLNHDIVEVKIRQINPNSSKWIPAKIIDVGNMRIWLMYMDGFKGSEFEIAGYSNEGDEISRFTDTTPWDADAEPQKSLYVY